MPTRHDFMEALMEGRWRPNYNVEKSDEGFKASYSQNGVTISASSPYSEHQAVTDVKSELKKGILEGKFYPPNQV